MKAHCRCVRVCVCTCRAAAAHARLRVFLHALQKGYSKASGALKSQLRVCATLILASSVKGK